MSKHFPPVPPQNQSTKGTGEHRVLDRDTHHAKPVRNAAKQAWPGRQSATHQRAGDHG